MPEKTQNFFAKIVPLEDYSFQVGRLVLRTKILKIIKGNVFLQVSVGNENQEVTLDGKAVSGNCGGVAFKFETDKLSKYQQIVDVELEAKM